jgi:2-amino-4-hydroxy-6-hydroxymethyldihydropteridine diphosphokinase
MKKANQNAGSVSADFNPSAIENSGRLCSNARIVEKDIFIALGSNVGDRTANLLRAVAEIARIPDSQVAALSPFYESEPVGMTAADDFLNAVLRLESSQTPDALLGWLMRIESEVFQRERSGALDSRRMDLDILFYGDKVIDRLPALLVPHPRLHARKFVLAPLAQIAPEFIHPLLHKTVRELLGELQDCSRVVKT